MLIYKNKLQICSFVNLPVLTSPTKVTISFNANINHLIAVSSFYQLIQFMLTGNCLFVCLLDIGISKCPLGTQGNEHCWN